MGKVWSDTEIEALVLEIVSSTQTTLKKRGEYLRALVVNAQDELPGRADKATQIATLKKVHKHFYEIVKRAVITPDIAKTKGLRAEERQRRTEERNRRANFARSSVGTILAWLRVEGHELKTINANTVTKGWLEENTPFSPKKARNRVEGLKDKLIDSFGKLYAADPEGASQFFREALSSLLTYVAEHDKTVHATTDAKVAAEEGRPLRDGRKLFWPVGVPRKG